MLAEQGIAKSVLAAYSALSGVAESAISDESTLREVDEKLLEIDVDPLALLAEAALAAARPEVVEAESGRDALAFVLADRDAASTGFGLGHEFQMSSQMALESLEVTNTAIKAIHEISEAFSVNLFELLGLRNLSAFVGELYKDQVANVMSGVVISNPNQDGHPDLLALTEDAKAFLEDLEVRGAMSAKEHFSPFRYGGIEVKSTCGNTPPARVMPKPGIGESRSPILTTLDWKAHHRETNYLLSIFWDFVEGIPTVLAVFFRNDLTEDDWGRMITPRGGSRTTSVSIMKSSGVKRMAEGWLILPEDPGRRQPILDAMRSGDLTL